MPILNETLTALSTGSQAASVVLREALRFKARTGSVIVQDATGRGAMGLSAAGKNPLERHRAIWVDLADRRRPVCLFQIRRSAHFRALWARVLRSLRDIAGSDVADATLDWAVEAAWSISADGSVGLTTLFRCISSPETRRWFLETGNGPAGLGKFLDLVSWTLSFSSVYGMCEGENRGDLLRALGPDNSARAPFADRVVVSMLGRGFHPEIGRQGFLRTRSRRQLVRGFTARWSKAMRYRSADRSPADILGMQARSLVKVFERTAKYRPFRMRW